MKEKEKIDVYIRTEHGKTVCICHVKRKGCRHICERDTVTRDRYEGWKATLYRNKYGK